METEAIEQPAGWLQYRQIRHFLSFPIPAYLTDKKFLSSEPPAATG